MTLLTYLNKNKDARKLFGKKEIEIIEKQLLGLRLTPSEQTRLSRDIKKKFEVIKKISIYEKELNLKKGQEINFLIEESKEIILEKFKPKIKKIILFGSHASKTQRKNSDIDLAIELKNKRDSKIRAELLGALPEKIDLQIYNDLPEKLKKEIKKEGKVIYQDE